MVNRNIYANTCYLTIRVDQPTGLPVVVPTTAVVQIEVGVGVGIRDVVEGLLENVPVVVIGKHTGRKSVRVAVGKARELLSSLFFLQRSFLPPHCSQTPFHQTVNKNAKGTFNKVNQNKF